jgi:hypothetical protein
MPTVAKEFVWYAYNKIEHWEARWDGANGTHNVKDTKDMTVARNNIWWGVAWA